MMPLPPFAVNKKSPVYFLCTWINQLVKQGPSCQLVGISLLLFSSVEECHTCSIDLLSFPLLNLEITVILKTPERKSSFAGCLLHVKRSVLSQG